MSEVYNKAKNFLEKSNACQKAIASLKDGSCILLIIDQQIPVCIQKIKGQIEISPNRVKNYDVLLKIHPDAFALIGQDQDLDLAQLGITILKQILIERIDVEIKASLLRLIRNGYFKIAILAGKPFLNFLSKYGLQHMGKIYAWVESKRSK